MAHNSLDDDRKIVRAAALRKSGRKREAIDIYSDLIARHPVSELYNERAVLFSECGEFDKAVVDLTDAIGLNPDDPDYYINRGNAYLWSGAYLEAIDDYEMAIALAPSEYVAYNNRGQALSELGRVDEAKIDFERSIQIEPDYSSPHFNLALLLNSAEDHRTALDSVDRAIQLNPEDAIAFSLRGEILIELGDELRAIDSFRRAIQLDSNCVQAHRRLCWLKCTSTESQVRNVEEALLHGRKCCEVTNWNDSGCLEAIAAAYASRGSFNEAIRWQSKAVSLVTTSRYDVAKERLMEYERRRIDAV